MTAVRPSLVYDCPNCPAESQGFNFLTTYEHPGFTGVPRKEFIVFRCGRCYYPVVVEIDRIVSEPASSLPLELTATYKQGHYTVRSVRPQRGGPARAPQHTPEPMGGCYEQGCRALQRGDADVAGMGFRKALDTATRYLIRRLNPPDLGAILARNLKQRVDWLSDQGRLTDNLKAWAHMMRDEGNDASHEEDPYTEAEAKDLHNLTEVFFMYVFTMPGMIKERRPDLVSTPVGAGKVSEAEGD
jgi:hypothetical protein